jgi:hypothetical protein
MLWIGSLFLVLHLSISQECEIAFTVNKIPLIPILRHQISTPRTSFVSTYIKDVKFRKIRTALREFNPKHNSNPPPPAVQGVFNGKAYSIELDDGEFATSAQVQRNRDNDGAHDGAHGDHHDHAHSDLHSLDVQLSETVSTKTEPEKDLRSRDVILSMVRSTWIKDGAPQVVLCILLMIVTKLVKVCPHNASTKRT